MRSCLGFLVLMGAAGSAAAQSENPGDIPTGHEAQVQLSNDTLQLKYISGGKKVGVDNSRFSGAFFLSEERDIVLSAGLVFPVDFDFGRLSVLVGPQAYAALLNDENNDVMALSLGAELRFVLDKDLDLAVAGHAYYAPDIMTFGSADSLTDLSAQVEIPLSDQMKGFAGMRWFEFDLTEGGGTQTLQEEIFVGIGYRF
ncbi:YfaZ family outer membrane protein [Peristeroidobacter agariperforans]|uniref:YfaZ family outer membrane protein n=1 Tax=Peristeroidobacter agariperforans TaxID=268404 RepID=UPI001300A0B0|nr:YfaZ family outer membrane protein [Peristeroidobacter agariperforans]